MKLKKEYQDKLDSLEFETTKEMIIESIKGKEYVFELTLQDAHRITIFLTNKPFSIELIHDMFE